MDALQKQIFLLKSYIATLEKENEARNQQKNTLFDSIDRLTAENDKLNSLISKNQNKSVSIPIQSNADMQEIIRLRNLNNTLIAEMQQLKRQIANFTSEKEVLGVQKRNSQLTNVQKSDFQNLKVTVSRLTINVRQKESQILRLTQQNSKILKQIQLSKQNVSRFSSSSTELTLLKNEVATYKSRISQLQLVQQNYKNGNTKLFQFQNQIRGLEVNLRNKESEYIQLDNQIKKLQIQNRELRSNSRSLTELSNLLTSKLSLEANIRQLNSKLEWSETNIKALQSDKLAGERRIKQLQRELLQVKGKLTQYKFSQESFKNLQANVMIKQKELQALQQMISSLKQNKKYLQRSLKEKEEIIVSLQSQLYTLRSANQDIQKQRNELNELRVIKSEYERQLTSFSKANQQFESQNYKLRLQIKTLTASLRENNSQKIFRPLSYIDQPLQQPKVKYVREQASNQNQDLRQKVNKLQWEVQEMKNSTNSRVFHYYQKPDIHLSNQKSSIMIRQKSPLRVNHSKLINEQDKQIINRNKWQNLQRKISVLRNENQALKRSLFQ